jgi:hypothetical protein
VPLSLLQQHAPLLATGLALRSLPFVGHAAVARGLDARVRGVALAIGALLSTAIARAPGDALRDLRYAPLGFAWFILIALALHFVAARVPMWFARFGGVFALAILGLVIAPIASWPYVADLGSRIVAGFFAAFGLEVAMGAHSYAVEVASRTASPSLRETVFFLLVHPNVVYREASVRVTTARVDARAITRIAVGAVVMIGRDASIVAVAASPLAAFVAIESVSTAGGYVRFVGAQLALALGLYCAHSGLASFQIGWMRLFGHELPERYRYAVFATSPQDFWNRWNTWTGEWARRHLFGPIALGAIRALGPRRGVTGAAAVVAFAGIGVLHDVGLVAVRATMGRYGWSFRMTVVFALFGVVLVVWRACGIALRRVRAAHRVRAAVGWVLAMQLVAWLSWLALAILRTGTFPPILERAWAAVACFPVG